MKKDEIVDHLGNDCQSPIEYYCEECGILVKDGEEGYVEDERCWCHNCLSKMEVNAQLEYDNQKEEGII